LIIIAFIVRVVKLFFPVFHLFFVEKNGRRCLFVHAEHDIIFF